MNMQEDTQVRYRAEVRHFANWIGLFILTVISSCTPATEKLITTPVATQAVEIATSKVAPTRLLQGETAYPSVPIPEPSIGSPYPESNLPLPQIATSTPRDGHPRSPQLAGLIYWNSDGLWQIQVDGSSTKIFDEAFAQLSQDGNRVLFVRDADIWLADLATGEQRNLTETPDRFECCP